MINTTAIMPIFIAILSILWVEIVRDLYHALAHIWQPLYRMHIWHHKVFKPDLTVTNDTIYRQANWYNDFPESLVMLAFSLLFGWVIINQEILIQYQWIAYLGSIYTLNFTLGAMARGFGVPYADEITDVTHRPGDFESLPANWFVNRPYHWRHHFDNQNAYFCGTFTLVDKIMGTALSLKGKKIAITGASGSLGKALLKQLHLQGAKVVALTSKNQDLSIEIAEKNLPIITINWQVGNESELTNFLKTIDILIINHGVNVHSKRDEKSIIDSYQINTFSSLKLIELFLKTVKTNEDIVKKEIWVNTSEAEVNPSFSPLYELSKRTLGDLITLKRLDAKCVIRKLILGPFKSNLNPIGVMSAEWVAKQIVNLAVRDFRDIIVTINPLTYVAFPIKELIVSIYLKLFTKSQGNV
jgi:sterol desaturase/sphingolipid hydroxylase (fatty acid hydroxylase superfamily)